MVWVLVASVCLFLACERYQGDISAPLYRDSDLSLVPCAVAGDAAREDLAALGDEEPERLYILVINEGRLVHAEPADFFPDLETPSFIAASAPGIPAVSPVSVSRIGTSIS